MAQPGVFWVSRPPAGQGEGRQEAWRKGRGEVRDDGGGRALAGMARVLGDDDDLHSKPHGTLSHLGALVLVGHPLPATHRACRLAPALLRLSC